MMLLSTCNATQPYAITTSVPNIRALKKNKKIKKLEQRAIILQIYLLKAHIQRQYFHVMQQVSIFSPVTLQKLIATNIKYLYS